MQSAMLVLPVGDVALILHCVQRCCPSREYVPAGQDLHADAADALYTPEYVPAEQFEHWL